MDYSPKKYMKIINAYDRDRLESVGLLQFKQTGLNRQDPNFRVANKEHVGRAKTFYITETTAILRFLGCWESAHVYNITPTQLEDLKTAKLVTDSTIQQYDTYNPIGNCFIDNDGKIYVAREYKILNFLDVWRKKAKE